MSHLESDLRPVIDDDVRTAEFLGVRFSLNDHGTRSFIDVSRVSDGTPLGQMLLDVAVAPDAEKFAELAVGWVAAQAGAVAPAPTLCASCSTTLAPVFGDSTTQFEDALHISFSGGYGMFIDSLEKGTPTALLCGGCARSLCDANPWIAALLSS